MSFYDDNQSKAAQEIGVSRGVIADVYTGRKKSLHASSLEKFYAAGWNVNWITTGFEKPRLEDMYRQNQDGPGGMAGAITRAFELMDRVEFHKDELKAVELPPDIDVQLIELGLAILKDRRKPDESKEIDV